MGHICRTIRRAIAREEERTESKRLYGSRRWHSKHKDHQEQNRRRVEVAKKAKAARIASTATEKRKLTFGQKIRRLFQKKPSQGDHK